MPALANWGDALSQGAGGTYGQGRVGSTLRSALVTGAAANTNITVTGMSTVDEIVSVVEMRNGLKQTLIVGGAAGNFTLTGIATEDRLISVLHAPDAGAVDASVNLTAEFTITAADTINNTAGTASTNGQLIVLWEDISTSHIDRTSIARITAKNTIQLTSATTGSKLRVLWSARRGDKYIA